MEENQIKIPSKEKIIAIAVSSFLITFVIARLFVYAVLGHLLPNFFLTVRGVHIHHFTYGVFILAILSYYLLVYRPKPESKLFLWSIIFYGIGLGLTFDEFGMWVRMEDNYWMRQSYDAIVVITLILTNIYYRKALWRWIKEIPQIFN